MPLNMENCAATIKQSSKKIIGGLVLEIGKKKTPVKQQCTDSYRDCRAVAGSLVWS